MSDAPETGTGVLVLISGKCVMGIREEHVQGRYYMAVKGQGVEPVNLSSFNDKSEYLTMRHHMTYDHLRISRW